jgi:ParB-like chromosome segregation protein Spo0J
MVMNQMNIVSVPIDSIKLDPKNARKHNKKNLKAIKGSLSLAGQQKNIVIDKNNYCVAGNGILMAAIELGWTHITAYKSDLDGDKLVAYALADNRTGDLSSFDDDLLKEMLQILSSNGMDIASFGFEDFDFGDNDKEKEENGSQDKFEILIKLSNEKDQREVYEDLVCRGYECVIL